MTMVWLVGRISELSWDINKLYAIFVGVIKNRKEDQNGIDR